jgi:hypothetical protein
MIHTQAASSKQQRPLMAQHKQRLESNAAAYASTFDTTHAANRNTLSICHGEQAHVELLLLGIFSTSKQRTKISKAN